MADEQYSRISRRMWRDAKFLGLSRPPASARELWFHLLSSPRSSSVPGLLAVGPMGLAEDLDWTVEADGWRLVIRDGAIIGLEYGS